LLFGPDCATETLRGVTCLIHQAKFFFRSLRLGVYVRDYLSCIRGAAKPDAIRAGRDLSSD
jgi:hypothetical protein